MASETVKNIKVEFKVDLAQFNKQMQSVSTKIDDVASTFKSTANDIKQSGDKITKNSGLKDLADQADKTSDALEDMIDAVEDSADSLEDLGDAGDEMDIIFDLSGATEEAFNDLSQAINESTDSLEEFGEAGDGMDVIFDLSGATETAMDDLGTTADTTADAVAQVGNNRFLTAFNAIVQQAGQAMQNLGKAVEEAGKKTVSFGKNVTKAVTLPIIGIGTVAAKTATDFEASMNQVAATMGMTVEEIANGSEDYNKLEQAAKDMGATTQFSAVQAAEALNYLALAGYDANKSVEMLPKVLDLAAAGGLDLAYASDLVTDSMSALGLSIDDADRFINEMAKTSQKSNTNIAQLGQGMLTVGGTAKSLAGGTAELSTALGILADNGIKSAEGGTAIRNIILSLSGTTPAVAKAIKKLGLEVYDAEGKMRPLNEVFGDLNEMLASMTEEEKTQCLSDIFNKVDLKSVNALLAATNDRTYDLKGALGALGIDVDANADKIRDLADVFNETTDKQTFIAQSMADLGISTKQATGMYEALEKSLSPVGSRFDELSGYIQESEGAASAMAETLNSGTKGALVIMKSALEGVSITIGERITPYVTKFAEKISELCDWFQNLSPEMQDNIIKWGALIAAIGPVITIFGFLLIFIGKIITAVGTITSAIAGLGTAFSAMGAFFSSAGTAIAGALGAISLPMVAIIAGIVAVVAGIWWLWNNWDTACQWVANAWEWVGNVFSKVVDFLKTALVAFLNFHLSAWETTLTAIGEFFQNIWNGICEFFISVGEALKAALLALLNYHLTVWKTVLTAISTFFKNIWNGITSFFKAILTGIKTALVAYLNFYLNTWKTVLTAISTFFQNIWNAITSFFKTTMTNIINFATSSWSNLKTLVSNFATGIKNGVVGAFNGLKNGVMNVWNGIVSGIKGCVNGIIKCVNGMIRGLNKIKVKVPDWVPGLGGNSIGFNIPEIPLLAKGGLLQGTAIVGEAGPELLQQTAHGTKVTPLSTHEKAGGISGALGGGFSVNIEKFINNTDRDIEELSYKLVSHINKNMKGRGLSYDY